MNKSLGEHCYKNSLLHVNFEKNEGIRDNKK